MNLHYNEQPYKATRLWNEVIIAFRTGMPLKRHRHRIRYYDNCFTAADCISWLNCYLKNNQNFGPHVTRQQTMQLLQKFVKSRVIESTVSKNSKIEFKDNAHLYKFVDYSPLKIQKTSPLQALLRTPFSVKNCNTYTPQYKDLKENIRGTLQFESNYKPRKDVLKSDIKSTKTINQNVIPECHIVERRLGVTEIENIWKTVTLHKLEHLLSPTQLEDLMDVTEISGKIIRHSLNKISKSGVVLLIDKTDDIPHWVISAMKCLANWPEASGTGSCLPNYPGFEKDVFKVVKDYFLNPLETIILPSLQPLINAAVYQILNINVNELDLSKSSHENSKSIKMNSLPQQTSTPMDKNHSQLNINSISDVNIQSAEGQLILNDSEAIWENPLSTIYETEFFANSPVTRVIHNPNLASNPSFHSLSSLASNNSLQYGSTDTLSTLSACSRMTKLSKCTISQSRQHLLDQKNETFNHNVTKQDLNDTFTGSLEGSLNLTFIDSQTVNQDLSAISYTENNQKNLRRHLSEVSFQKCKNSRSAIGNFSQYSLRQRNVNNFEFKTQSLCNVFEYREDSKLQSQEPTSNVSRINKSINCSFEIFNSTSQSPEQRELLSRFKDALQIILLFLPLSNRRQLHLLLRMINKILKNNKLILDEDLTTKDYLLDTFLPAVMDYNSNSILHKKYAYNLFSYMVKECESILKPSEIVKEEAHCRLSALQRRTIKYSLDDFSLTYCELISRQQYEEQKLSASRQALSDLLDAILLDEKISEKEKRKKLKQFKENHPDIIKQKFPNLEDMEHLFNKAKKPLLARFLSLRM